MNKELFRTPSPNLRVVPANVEQPQDDFWRLEEDVWYGRAKIPP